LPLAGRSRLDERGSRGTPDWVVEALSPSTAAEDQLQKLAAHERAGAREVWLVYPTDRAVIVYTLERRRGLRQPCHPRNARNPGARPVFRFADRMGPLFPDASAETAPPPTEDSA